MIRSEDVCFASLLGERREDARLRLAFRREERGERALGFALLLGERREERGRSASPCF
jgi:hypothetical protein